MTAHAPCDLIHPFIWDFPNLNASAFGHLTHLFPPKAERVDISGGQTINIS